MYTRQAVFNILVGAIVANLLGLVSSEEDASSVCQVFVAPSSIPNGGLGVYAGESIKKGEQILSEDMVVQFIDRNQQKQLRLKHEKRTGQAKNDTWAFWRYAVDGHWTMGSFEAKQVESLPYSLSMLANSHPVLHNVKMMPPTEDPAVNDIHAGATASYHGLYAQATQDIEVGEEILLSMDPKKTKNDPALQIHPHASDYITAQIILQNFQKLVPDLDSKEANVLWKLLWMSNNKWKDDKQTLTQISKPLHELQEEHKKNRVLSKIKTLSKGNLSSKKAVNIWKFLKSVSPNDNILKVLPRKVENVRKALELGVPKASLPNRVRDRSWLKQNGICISNLQPRTSNIPYAGRGAFATQSWKKDATITAIPVAPFDRSLVQMYKNMGAHVWKKGFQQLLNYAFGHEQSSVLLLPYSPVVPYINHDSNPNAKLRWSTLNNHSMLELTADDLLSPSMSSGLVMELVATRSIEQNEEMTIDYGPIWQEAWEDFLAGNGPKERSPGYRSAAELNQKKAHLFTEEELRHNSHLAYPSNVELKCFASFFERQQDGIRWWQDRPGLFNSTKFVRPCNIKARMFQEMVPVAEMPGHKHDGREDEMAIARNSLRYDAFAKMEVDGISEQYVRYDVVVHTGTAQGDLEIVSLPRHALRFFDKAYTSDLHIAGAFRHEIGVPEDLFPASWKDLV